MDPDANLAEQRQIFKRMDFMDSYGEEPLREGLTRLAELTQAMDGWLSGGGFLPKEWMKDGRHQTTANGVEHH